MVDKIKDWREAELITRRDYLRNLTKECESKSVEELQVLMIELGI